MVASVVQSALSRMVEPAVVKVQVVAASAFRVAVMPSPRAPATKAMRRIALRMVRS